MLTVEILVLGGFRLGLAGISRISRRNTPAAGQKTAVGVSPPSLSASAWRLDPMRRPSQVARADGPNHAHHRITLTNPVHAQCKLQIGLRTERLSPASA